MDRKANGINAKRKPIVKVVDIHLTKEREQDKARKFYLFSDSKNPS